MTEITITPSPAKQGKTITICYDGALPRKLTLDWSPANAGVASVNCPSPGGCVSITAPANATSLIVHDPSGAAADEGVVIGP